MAVLDFILNCVCLLLWLNWRSRGLGALPNRPPALELVGTLRRAGPSERERWSSPLVLAAVLLLRAIVYWQFGASAHWSPQLSFAGFVVHFRPDVLGRMLVFSLLSFTLVLGAFYFSLLLIAAANRDQRQPDPWTVMVRAHLGALSKLPGWACLLLPFFIAFLLWLAVGPFLSAIQVHVPLRSFGQLCAEAAIVGAGGWLLWKYVLVALLTLHVVSNYVYLGNAPFWHFIHVTARNLLRPLARLPLRAGRIDFAPLVALLLVALASVYLSRLLAGIYRPS